MSEAIIKRWIPKWVLWAAIFMNIVFLIIGCLYLFTQFDLPYVNSGDKSLVYSVTIVWWALSSLAVLGWKITE